MPLFVSEESEKFLLPSCSGLFSEPGHLAHFDSQRSFNPPNTILNTDIMVAKRYFFLIVIFNRD